MEESEAKGILTQIRNLDMSILTVQELTKLNEVLETMFTDEIENWYNAVSRWDTFNGRVHHFCASILDIYIKETHNRILGKVVVRDIL